MLLALPYVYAAVIYNTIINDSGLRWLYQSVLIFVWDAFKLLWIGPVSLVLLVATGAHGHEKRQTRHHGADRVVW